MKQDVAVLHLLGHNDHHLMNPGKAAPSLRLHAQAVGRAVLGTEAVQHLPLERVVILLHIGAEGFRSVLSISLVCARKHQTHKKGAEEDFSFHR